MLEPFASSARRIACCALFGLCMLAGQALAAGRSWVADGDGGAAWIIYGTPESDDVLLSVTCDKAAKTLVILFATEPAAATNPETLPLEIASEGGRVTVQGQGRRSDIDDAFTLEATMPLTPDVEALLTGAKTLSVRAQGGGKADMPLDEIAMRGAGDVVKACK